MPAAIQIVGLKEFVRDVRRADAGLPKELRLLMNRVGQEILEPEIERRMVSLIKKSQGHGLVPSVRSRSTQREGRVMAGFARSVEYAGWWEFGGSTHSPRGNTMRERVPGGRTMYPTLRDRMPQIALAMEDVLNQIVHLIDPEA